MESCAGCVRSPLQPSLAEGCSLQFGLQPWPCLGYTVHATPLVWRLLHGLTLGISIPGLLPVISFGCCVCTLLPSSPG